ncbi:MAG TPA: hypothetical protein VGC04_05600 [Cellulomonas sp.]
MRRQGRVGMWFLVGITLGIYGLFWYARTNAGVASGLGVSRTADSRWWSQIIPIFSVVGVHESAKRINAFAGQKVISPVATWLFWSWFFQGAYVHLQGGVNRACDLRGISR